MNRRRRRSGSGAERLWKGLLAGAAGGLLAAGMMNGVNSLWSRLTEARPRPPNRRPEQEKGPQDDDATVKTAQAISTSVFHHRLSRKEKKIAGPAVHYAFGSVTGALYGALAEAWPAAAMGAGMPFGAALWLGADEVMVPLLGLARPPTRYPLSVHARAAHAPGLRPDHGPVPARAAPRPLNRPGLDPPLPPGCRSAMLRPHAEAAEPRRAVPSL